MFSKESTFKSQLLRHCVNKRNSAQIRGTKNKIIIANKKHNHRVLKRDTPYHYFMLLKENKMLNIYDSYSQ